MSKRSSEYQLTKDNYDDDDDNGNGNGDQTSSEQHKANADVLKNRVVIKAKRKNLDDSTTLSTSNVFSGFKGFTSFGSGGGGGNDSKSSSNFAFKFGTTTSTTTTAASEKTTATTSSDTNNSSFTFGSKLSTGINPKENGNNHITSDDGDKTKIDIPSCSTKSNVSIDHQHPENDDKESEIFLANLNKLNKSFAEHISQYTSNPK